MDAADYNVWRANYGNTASAVDFSDYVIWRDIMAGGSTSSFDRWFGPGFEGGASSFFDVFFDITFQPSAGLSDSIELDDGLSDGTGGVPYGPATGFWGNDHDEDLWSISHGPWTELHALK